MANMANGILDQKIAVQSYASSNHPAKTGPITNPTAFAACRMPNALPLLLAPYIAVAMAKVVGRNKAMPNPWIKRIAISVLASGAHEQAIIARPYIRVPNWKNLAWPMPSAIFAANNIGPLAAIK